MKKLQPNTNNILTNLKYLDRYQAYEHSELNYIYRLNTILLISFELSNLKNEYLAKGLLIGEAESSA